MPNQKNKNQQLQELRQIEQELGTMSVMIGLMKARLSKVIKEVEWERL